ncbi:MAG: alpha-ketoglutarate-dependent dioxygenase AlkB [Roseivirga sp.]
MSITGVSFIESFTDDPSALFHSLSTGVNWDERMAARKTASYGVAYNYSQMSYPYQAFLPELDALLTPIEEAVGFRPNNCLLNYYLDGKSRMGFHSDQTDILASDTGVVIISLGATRALTFRNIEDGSIRHSYMLPSGSLIYMTQAVQDEWQHAIPRDNTAAGRISLTFRNIQA